MHFALFFEKCVAPHFPQFMRVVSMTCPMSKSRLRIESIDSKFGIEYLPPGRRFPLQPSPQSLLLSWVGAIPFSLSVPLLAEILKVFDDIIIHTGGK
jgi:hypothetical protein